MSPQLCIGTAQFGLPYGITNSSGLVNEQEVRSILSNAADAGMSWIDTAQSYGDAESILGRNLPLDKTFNFISKLPKQVKNYFEAKDQENWEHNFQSSLRSLRSPSLDSYLLHSVGDLFKPGSHFLLEWLLSLRERGLVRRLGASIYSSSDLHNVPIELLDLIQLPLSLYDQRFIEDGTIKYLTSNGCAVHARSIYLQGLLLTSSSNWPAWVNNSFRQHHQQFEKYVETQNSSLISHALGFAYAQEDLEAVVIGLCSLSQFSELICVWDALPSSLPTHWQDWALPSSDFLDPRLWPSS